LKGKKVVSLTLAEEDLEALKELADAEGIPLTEKVRKMLVPFLREYRKAKEARAPSEFAPLRPLTAEVPPLRGRR